MAKSETINTIGRIPSINKIIQDFWVKVNVRLVKVHRVSPMAARKAVRIYRKRVGNIALNRGELETAADIAAAVRHGGFRAVNVLKSTHKTSSAGRVSAKRKGLYATA
jgi:hypothetical protein